MEVIQGVTGILMVFGGTNFKCQAVSGRWVLLCISPTRACGRVCGLRCAWLCLARSVRVTRQRDRLLASRPQVRRLAGPVRPHRVGRRGAEPKWPGSLAIRLERRSAFQLRGKIIELREFTLSCREIDTDFQPRGWRFAIQMGARQKVVRTLDSFQQRLLVPLVEV